MSLDKKIAVFFKTIPKCIACGVVDITTGMLLSIKTTDNHPQEVLDLVSAATGEFFQGTYVVAIENMFKQARGVTENDHHYFQEILINSDNLIHIFQRGKRNKDMVLVTVCRITANLGLVFSKARLGLAAIEEAF